MTVEISCLGFSTGYIIVFFLLGLLVSKIPTVIKCGLYLLKYMFLVIPTGENC